MHVTQQPNPGQTTVGRKGGAWSGTGQERWGMTYLKFIHLLSHLFNNILWGPSMFGS